MVKLYVNHEPVTLRMGEYYNGNLAISLDCCEGPYATITVNLDGTLCPEYAYVDTNNCPWAEEFIEKYHLGESTGLSRRSGYCEYPLYKFDIKKLEALER